MASVQGIVRTIVDSVLNKEEQDIVAHIAGRVIAPTFNDIDWKDGSDVTFNLNIRKNI
eukprot:m.180472 g.180472  ORF g.180472 m.180472 type:complete len:58 (+) comp25420_c0_seq2:139-312(+)